MLIAAIKLHIIMYDIITYLQSKIKDRLLPSHFAQHTRTMFDFGNLPTYYCKNTLQRLRNRTLQCTAKYNRCTYTKMTHIPSAVTDSIGK